MVGATWSRIRIRVRIGRKFNAQLEPPRDGWLGFAGYLTLPQDSGRQVLLISVSLPGLTTSSYFSLFRFCVRTRWSGSSRLTVKAEEGDTVGVGECGGGGAKGGDGGELGDLHDRSFVYPKAVEKYPSNTRSCMPLVFFGWKTWSLI